MARAQFQAKKGLNGSSMKKSPNWPNKGSGVSGNNPNSPQTSWQGTTKGGTKSKSGKGG